MTIIKIWHNPRCQKSREGLQYLMNKGIQPEVINYLKGEFKPEDLTVTIRLSHHPLVDFIRKNEKEYKELNLKNKDLSIEEFSELVQKYPKLLQRPIVTNGIKTILARPAEKIDELF